MSKPIPATAVWALGVTQIVGYGSLYYAFSVLAPDIAESFGWSAEWIFGALTVSLLLGGLVAPFAGRLLDMIGAARGMSLGSLLVSAALVLMALAPSGPLFTLALMLMEMASTLVLYAAAFAVLVQLGGQKAQASITHLTLIAGFASTLFWPLTALISGELGWRGTYLVFAALNILVCLPLHFWLSRRPGSAPASAPAHPATDADFEQAATPGRHVYALVLAGFAMEGFVLAAVTLQMVPLLLALKLDAHMVLVSTLFGPAQVLARLVNMVFGGRLRPTSLAIIAAASLPLALLLLVLTSPALAGAIGFAILFGLGSGLTSIVAGALPLFLFGRYNYGARQGQISAARQVAAAAAPFAMALAISQYGAGGAVWIWAALAVLPVVCFAVVLAASPLPGRTPAMAAREPARQA
jgi:predicted MFS family arabinose efflux permease